MVAISSPSATFHKEHPENRALVAKKAPFYENDNPSLKFNGYGMICCTNSFKLDDFPKPDEYSEIQQSARFIGGETGTCATVLSSLGAEVRIDGTHIGRSTAQLTRDFYKGKLVDLGSLTFDNSFEGLEDYVIISDSERTPFGRFGHFFSKFYSSGVKHWNAPKDNDIAWCDFAAIDDCFGEDSKRCAEFCVKSGIETYLNRFRESK